MYTYLHACLLIMSQKRSLLHENTYKYAHMHTADIHRGEECTGQRAGSYKEHLGMTVYSNEWRYNAALIYI